MKHIWHCKRFHASIILQAEAILGVCRSAHLRYGQAVLFLGYAVERLHQASWLLVPHPRADGDGVDSFAREIAQRLAACIRTGHRYAQGPYQVEYLAAGQHLLQAVGARHGLAVDTPPEV